MGNTEINRRKIIESVKSKATGEFQHGKCPYCTAIMLYKGQTVSKCVVCDQMVKWE